MRGFQEYKGSNDIEQKESELYKTRLIFKF